MSKDNLDELANKERREYFKQWRAKNPEKVKQQNKTYWEKRAMRKLEEEKTASSDQTQRG